MSYPLNHDCLLFNIKLDAVIAGAHPIASRKTAPEGLGSADCRPILEPLEHIQHPAMNDRREALYLPKSLE
jgi:hypothetical protein